MITKKIKIQIQNGLEARPVAVLVQVASQFNSSPPGGGGPLSHFYPCVLILLA